MELHLAVEAVSAVLDLTVVLVGVNVVVGQRLHRLQTPVGRAVLGNGQDHPLVVILVASPGDALVRIVTRVEKVVDQKPVRLGFHRRVMHVGL